MLVLGHAGLTLGAAALLTLARRRRSSQNTPASDPPEVWLTLARRVDVRLLLVGSLLPDIIDKPVGHLLFRETFSNGRIFSHTLLFIILLSLAGIYLYRRRRRRWPLVLAFGSFAHLVFDQMWRAPGTLFWPVFGFAFERGDLANWIPDMFWVLLTNPGVYVPELLGGVMLLWFGLTLVRRRRVFVFVRYGRVES